MATVRVEVLSGDQTGRSYDSQAHVLRIGRAEHTDVRLSDAAIAPDHARIVLAAEATWLEDLGSGRGTAIVREGERIDIGDDRARAALRSGDQIELGGDVAPPVALRVTLDAVGGSDLVVSEKPLAEPVSPDLHSDAGLTRALYRWQERVAAAADLHEVLGALADAALELVPRATHVTFALRDESEEAPPAERAYVPVLTRARGQEGQAPAGAIPITHSIFRKVVRDRSAVLMADAPREALGSESLIGANVRSTIAVPLWQKDDILGVLQLDNRTAPGMFDPRDLELTFVLAANASLAIANARLIRRLSAAEDRLRGENTFLKQRARTDAQMIGASPPMRRLLESIDKVANTRVSVLIEGETGAGKELVASLLHERSRRAPRLFVAQNCAALPENLLESELFGHKRGAFTGATEEKKGLFEVADGGTLFLDEVTEMPLSLQAKLLRVLQEGEIRAVGSTASRSINVRIVAATNRSLEKEVAEGRFREDLYYRLKVFPIRVPPLRERRDDIPQLCSHFLQRYTREFGKPVAGFAQPALDLLCDYDWPGNVRELQNEVQRLVIEADADGFVTADLVSPRIRKIEATVGDAGARQGTLKEKVEQVEKFFVLQALREHGNNKTNAAKALGITREGLHKKLRQLGIG